MTTDATEEDITWLFSTTPANLVVVSYDVWEDECDKIAKKVRRAVAILNKVRVVWDPLLLSYGAIYAKTSRFRSFGEKVSIGGDGPHRFICCDFNIRESRLSANGIVTLGFVASMKSAGPYEESWMKMVRSAVAENNVHYMCGVFWRKKKEIEALFKQLGATESGVFFQPWWTEERHARFDPQMMSALGARFGIQPQSTRHVAVYPAYLVALGTRADGTTRPELARQPLWREELFPCGSAMERGAKDLSAVPQLPEHIAPGANTRAWLPLMQKPAPLNKWKKGVHQLLLWIGSSRPSKGSAEKKKQAWRGKQRRRYR